MVNTYFNFKYNKKKNRITGYDSHDIDNIRLQIKNSEIVVLKNVFRRELMHKIKKDCFNFIRNNQSSNPKINQEAPNFYRIDNNPKKSAVKRVKQSVVSFYWNEPISYEQECMTAMSILRNKIAQLPTNFSLNKIEDDGFFTFPSIAHYPSGGGKLNKHTDPPNKQFSVILCSLSKRGEDFKTGGLYIYVKNKKIDIDEIIEEGDIYLMNPANIHGIDAIDRHSSLDFENINGRWVLFPALIEIKTTSGIKVKGLKDLDNSENN